MGVVPMLLLVATLGVNYGWQSDGGSGVEYIIQIPPEQIGEIERLGEITSTIDPAVRGRVSKIIVRVGTGTLPRETPKTFSSAAVVTEPDVVAEADHVSVPIPQIGNDSGVTTVASDPASEKSTVLKPQTGDSGQNFSLPPLGTGPVSPPPRVGPTAPGSTLPTQSDIDAAIGRANSAIDAAAATANALGASGNGTALQAPAFTGSDLGSLARPRNNGPSTEPISPRDKAWNELGPRRPGIPTTNPVDPRTGGASALAGPTTQGATGVGRNDTFGRPPAGMALPNRNPNSSLTAAPRTGTSTAQLQVPAPGVATAGNDGLIRGSAPSSNANLFPNSTARQNTPSASSTGGAPRLTASQLASLPPGTWTVDAYGRAVNKQGQLIDAFGRPIPGGENAIPGGARSNSATAVQTDPRQIVATQGAAPSNRPLTAPQNFPTSGQFPANRQSPTLGQIPGTASQIPAGSQVPAGGQVLGTGQAFAGGQTPGVGPIPPDGRNPSSMGQFGSGGQFSPSRDPVATGGDSLRYPRSASDASLAGVTNRRGGTEYETSDRGGTPLGGRTGSLGQERGGSSNLRSEIEPVASTPLINFLLLISFVVNIYLIAWFQKVRHRIRELVAAKRSATPAKAAN